MVLLFAGPWRSASSSHIVKTRFSRSMTSTGERRAESVGNPTTSGKRAAMWSDRAAMAAPARGEAHDVGEEDGHVVEPVRDDGLAAAEPLGDRRRQDVEQEALVGGAEDLDLAGGGDVRAVHVDRVVLVHRDDAEAEDPAFGLDLEGRVSGGVPGGEDPGEHRRGGPTPHRAAASLP